MNKVTLVLGAAAVATLAGCKDPDYVRGDSAAAQNEAKNVDTTVVVEQAPAKCQCPPGTKHAEPCKCGASDCKCIVEQKPVIVVDVSKPVVTPAPAPAPVVTKPAEPAYTIYVVQNGDYLAKISKKFNVTIASIKRLNPSIKKDVIRVGQKLKLPGKIDVGVQSAPVVKTVKTAKKGYTAYTGETKEYIVKSGDTLGAVAYGNGCNIRQLKELNGLTKDTLRIGQKLKVPAAGAAKKVKAAKADVPVKKAAAKPVEASKQIAAPVAEKPAEAAPAAEAKPTETPAPAAEAKSAEAAAPAPAQPTSTTTYVVQEGDDITGVSIRWGVTSAEIRELNNLGENDQLVPGQIIKLPAEAQQ